jgi:NDP-sugar pyrophosphorylase family protein
MPDLALVMPMAGAGSRFSALGETRPKPLINLGGRPFFTWAVDSVLRAVEVREMVFVVLEAHVREHAIDEAICLRYPSARVVAIDGPTAGAAETAALGVAALSTPGPIAINDCDHAFLAQRLGNLAGALARGGAGGVVGFASDNPAYSFARLASDDATRVVGTVEKQRVGPFAIAGCYLFGGARTFLDALALYRQDCPYPELFISGLYNLLCQQGATVRFQALDFHLSFGTPEELARVTPEALQRLEPT